jgi:hypothetical protein
MAFASLALPLGATLRWWSLEQAMCRGVATARERLLHASSYHSASTSLRIPNNHRPKVETSLSESRDKPSRAA